MSYIKKIRYKRNQFLSVGNITITQGDTEINIDRSKAYMSSIFEHIQRRVFQSSIITRFSQTNNPSVTSDKDGIWEITLDKAYKNLKIRCYTNADSIELYGENDVLISSHNYSSGFQSSRVEPNSKSFGESWKEYIAPTILPLQSINCNSKKFSGTVEGCILGTDREWSACPGYGPYTDPQLNNFRENLRQFGDNREPIRYKIINSTPCGFVPNLPDKVIVYEEDLVKDGCISYYKKCVGDNCNSKDKDGNKIHHLGQTLGCTNGIHTAWKFEDCNNNKRKKTRQCIQPLNGGKPCPNLPLEELEDCSNAVMSYWSPWTCVNNKATRTRTCIKEATNGGASCSTELLQKSDCYDAVMSDWSPWSCVNNKATRTRTCTKEAINGGKPCSTELSQKADCSDGKLTEWKFEECTNNKKKKTRQCIQPLNGGNPCPNLPLEESEDCGITQNQIILIIIICVIISIIISSSILRR